MVKKQTFGFTLTEMMITVAILGVIAMVGPTTLKNITRFFRMNSARLETNREARGNMDRINKMLRQAYSSSIIISQETNQPPYSSISFSTIDGRSIKYYQQGNKLNFVQNGSTQTVTDLLRYIAFAYPRTDDPGIISVSLTFEKKTYEGGTKALHMAIEKVRVMN